MLKVVGSCVSLATVFAMESLEAGQPDKKIYFDDISGDKNFKPEENEISDMDVILEDAHNFVFTLPVIRAVRHKPCSSLEMRNCSNCKVSDAKDVTLICPNDSKTGGKIVESIQLKDCQDITILCFSPLAMPTIRHSQSHSGLLIKIMNQQYRPSMLGSKTGRVYPDEGCTKPMELTTVVKVANQTEWYCDVCEAKFEIRVPRYCCEDSGGEVCMNCGSPEFEQDKTYITYFDEKTSRMVTSPTSN